MVLGSQRDNLGAWQPVFATVPVPSMLWFVGYAVRERVKGMPELFCEQTGWQRLARMVSIIVFMLGTLTFIFG